MKDISSIKTDGIIFDLDGTLWDATGVTAETWKSVLAENPGVTPAVELTVENIRKYMGLTNAELGKVFFPGLSQEEQLRLMYSSCALENKWLGERGGVLYPGVLCTLSELSRKYKLYIVSNCQCGYIECFLGANGGAEYISDFECSDNTGLEKSENIRLIAQRNNIAYPVYVGDTTSDSTAAEKCGVPFIYAKYGFGESFGRGRVESYEYAIDKFSDLLKLL